MNKEINYENQMEIINCINDLKSNTNILQEEFFNIFKNPLLEKFNEDNGLFYEDFKKLSIEDFFNLYNRLKILKYLEVSNKQLNESEDLIVEKIDEIRTFINN